MDAQPPAADDMDIEAFFPYRLALLAEAVSRSMAQIYAERVTTRGYGSGAWGWRTAYKDMVAG